MMTKKSRKQEKSETAIGLKIGTMSSSGGHIFPPALLSDVRLLIEGARARAAVAVNSEMVRFYWSIGERIRKETLGFERAAYWEKIVHALSEQLSWTHLRQIIYLEDSLRREFYPEMCRIERCSTRILQDKIQGMLYERTAIGRKPGQLARKELSALRDKDQVTPDLVFRDPYESRPSTGVCCLGAALESKNASRSRSQIHHSDKSASSGDSLSNLAQSRIAWNDGPDT